MLAAVVELGEEAENFQVEPHQRDHDAEGSVPFHVLGCAGIDSALDKIEVQDEVEGGDYDDDEADADAERAGVVQHEETNAEKAGDHLDEVEQGDSPGSCGNADGKLLRDADDAGAVDEQHGEQGTEGEADSLDADAMIAGFKDCGDAAEEEAFAERVKRRSDRRPSLLEDGDHGKNEATDGAEHEKAGDGCEVAALREQVPGVHGAGNSAQKQDTGLVDGAAQGHAGRGVDGSAEVATVLTAILLAESLVVERRVRSFH